MNLINQPVDRKKELRILVVRLSALGDTALTLPLLFALRKYYPSAYIGWVVGEAAAPLLEGQSELNRLHIWKKSKRNPIGLWRLARELRSEDYTLSIDAQGLAVSAIIPVLARIKKRIGFVSGHLEGREFSPAFYTSRVLPPDDLLYVSDRILSLLHALNLKIPEQTAVVLPRNTHAEKNIAQWWRDKRIRDKTMVFGIGAGWPTKIWTVKEIEVLIEAAQKKGFTCIVIWGPHEKSHIQEWSALEKKGALLAPPTDIPEMIALLRRCEKYAGPDSAPLHLACLLGKPTFSWFGASDPARCAPRGILHAHVACGPHNWHRKKPLKSGLQSLEGKDALPVFENWLSRS